MIVVVPEQTCVTSFAVCVTQTPARVGLLVGLVLSGSGQGNGFSTQYGAAQQRFGTESNHLLIYCFGLQIFRS